VSGAIKVIRRTARYALDAGTVFAGLGEYCVRGDISPRVRTSLLRMHCRTNGKFTDLLSPLMRAARPPRKASTASGVLGTLSAARQKEIADAITRDGFYVFENRLPENVCDEIDGFARKVPALIEGSDKLTLFNPGQPVSKTYRILEPDVVKSSAMQRLMADRSILAVAETYLKTHPILSGAHLWYSPAYGNAPGSDAAQEFHFDFDPPPIWLLFFVYLTDVGPDNGPHVFVRGTHTPGHPEMADLLARGYARIPDEDIVGRFGADRIVELYGKRGTILAVDTRGFHKGKMPVIGHRLMGQLSFSCPAFSGAHGRTVKLPQTLDPALETAIAETPGVFNGHYRR
jgi:hypothetical protein